MVTFFILTKDYYIDARLMVEETKGYDCRFIKEYVGYCLSLLLLLELLMCL